MPTGYTAIIGDKPDVTFEEFAWGCARAFGAFIMQRDDPQDAPLILKDDPNPYYQDAITKAKAELARIQAATDEELTAEAQAKWQESQRSAREAIAKKDALRARYEAMLAKAEAWQPPSADHAKFRDFMIQQLSDSVKWDCGDTYWYDQLREKPQTAQEYREDRARMLQKDIDYHTTAHAEEVARVAGRNRWKQQLVDSLGLPPVNHAD